MKPKIKVTVVELPDTALFKAAGLNPERASELIELRRKRVLELLERQPRTRCN